VTGARPGLHPAQNRALRELYATARQLGRHWTPLADRLGGGPGVEELRAGVRAADELLEELPDVTAGYDLHGLPAAQGVGLSLAGLRNAGVHSPPHASLSSLAMAAACFRIASLSTPSIGTSSSNDRQLTARPCSVLLPRCP
jgi:hypothetical protein